MTDGPYEVIEKRDVKIMSTKKASDRRAVYYNDPVTRSIVTSARDAIWNTFDFSYGSQRVFDYHRLRWTIV